MEQDEQILSLIQTNQLLSERVKELLEFIKLNYPEEYKMLRVSKSGRFFLQPVTQDRN